jgi:hypothetical protein
MHHGVRAFGGVGGGSQTFVLCCKSVLVERVSVWDPLLELVVHSVDGLLRPDVLVSGTCVSPGKSHFLGMVLVTSMFAIAPAAWRFAAASMSVKNYSQASL